MKILSIGNSFSQDAHKWLKPIADADGFPLDAVNLMIGGCSLERHYNNMLSGAEDYGYELNARKLRMTSLDGALDEGGWDIITLQQYSRFSGVSETYVPYITELANHVREKCPSAKIYIHKTWAYEKDSVHAGFEKFNNDQYEMYRRLSDAYAMAAKLIDAPIIPVGDVIQKLRDECPVFDYEKTGRSLNRDGFHLSFCYGRYAAAATWYAVLTGNDIKKNGFIPSIEEMYADKEIIEMIKKTVAEVTASN